MNGLQRETVGVVTYDPTDGDDLAAAATSVLTDPAGPRARIVPPVIEDTVRVQADFLLGRGCVKDGSLSGGY